MSTIIRGIGENELKPGHDFRITRSTEGLWTASLTAYCRGSDYGNALLQAQFQPGTAITSIQPEIPAVYNFITLDSFQIANKKGNITEIALTFTGADDDDGFQPPGPDERSTSTTLRGVFQQAPVIEHPEYLKAVTNERERSAIAALWKNEARAVVGLAGNGDPLEYEIQQKSDITFDYGVGGPITDASAFPWIELILRGVRFYDKPMVEYSITQTNKGGITQEELDLYGRKVDVPPGNPLRPTSSADHSWWHFNNITETKDENSSVYSRTYLLRDDEFIELLYGDTSAP